MQLSPKHDFLSAGKAANIRSSLASVNFASPINAVERSPNLLRKDKEHFAAIFSKSSKKLPASLALAILEAEQDDQPVVAECAQILNEIILKVEQNQAKGEGHRPHMSKYVSRKTIRKQEEEERMRKMTLELEEANKQQRSKSLKASMAEKERFIKEQIERVRKEKEEQDAKKEEDENELLKKE